MSTTVYIAISVKVYIVDEKFFTSGTRKTASMETNTWTHPTGKHGEHSALHCQKLAVIYR